MTRYEWPHFAMVADPDAGTVITTYPAHRWTGGAVVPEDAHHAARLGITAFHHRLTHELLHHVAAQARRLPESETHGCRILWRSAHGLPQVQPEADTDEWVVTALTYLVHGARMPSPSHYGALLDLEQSGVDVPALAEYVRWLLAAAQYHVTVTVQVPMALTRIHEAA